MAHLPLWMDGLTPEMIKKAEVELGENPDVKAKALEDFERLINEKADSSAPTEDIFLLRFLRVRKYNVQKAFETLQNFYEFKRSYSGVITDFKPSQLKLVFEMNKFSQSPYRNSDGAVVTIVSIGTIDLNRTTAQEILAISYICSEVALEREATQVCGVVLVWDFQGITLDKLRRLSSPSYLYCIAKSLQDCWPFRINAVHMVNEPMYLGPFYKCFRMFLSSKLKKRFLCHGSNLEKLHRYISPELLPEELGGKLDPNYKSDYVSHILGEEAFIEKMNSYGYPKRQENRRKSSLIGQLFK